MGLTAPNPKRYSTAIPYDFCPDPLVRLYLFPFCDKLVLDARNEATSRLGLLMNLYVRKSTRTSWNLFFECNGYKTMVKRTKMTPENAMLLRKASL